MTSDLRTSTCNLKQTILSLELEFSRMVDYEKLIISFMFLSRCRVVGRCLSSPCRICTLYQSVPHNRLIGALQLDMCITMCTHILIKTVGGCSENPSSSSSKANEQKWVLHRTQRGREKSASGTADDLYKFVFLPRGKMNCVNGSKSIFLS